MEMTPEKLAIMKLNLNEHEGYGLFDGEPTTPGNVHKTTDFSIGNGMSSSRSVARTRQFSRSSHRRSSSIISSHRNKMAADLTTEAESKFFSLVELMSNASREASSLREFWSRIVSERESYAQEREELVEQITAISEELEQKANDFHRHGNEAGERKKQVEKLLLELSTAISDVSAQKKLVADREHELDRLRRELSEVREVVARTHTEHEKIRNDFDMLELTLKTAEGDRDGAREEADRIKLDLHRTVRERTEISGRLTEITSKHDVSRKEVLSLTDRIKMHDLEREEMSHECDRLREDARKSRAKADDSSRELIETTDKYERLQREVHKVKENIGVIESERDELAHIIEHLRREVKATATGREEAEDRCSEFTIKYEHIKRELLSVKAHLRDVELERTELNDTIERTRETHRLVLIERDEIKDEVNNAHRKAEDRNRRVIALTESLRRAESSLSEVRSEVTTLTERTKLLSHERDDARAKHGHHMLEITELKGQIVIFQAEIRTLTDARDRLRGDLEKTRAEMTEITETVTSFQDGSSELEFEIDSLRTMLREAREQKERAITGRNAADRERDEAIAKYEEKCRELERFEESAASHYHAHASVRNGGETRTTTSRMVSSSNTAGTAVHNSN